MVNKYLVEYISQNKKEINGAEYANLVDQLSEAKDAGFLNIYDNRLIERIVQIFLKDHQELYYFSTKDILKLLKGFDAILPQLEQPEKYAHNVRQNLI